MYGVIRMQILHTRLTLESEMKTLLLMTEGGTMMSMNAIGSATIASRAPYIKSLQQFANLPVYIHIGLAFRR